MVKPELGPDVQIPMCRFLYADTLAPIIDKGSTIPEDEPEGHVIASIRTPPLLSVLAQVCKTFHQELNKHRNERLQALVRQVIDLTPGQAIELLNINNYDPEDWLQAVDSSILLFDVYLGSRLRFAVSLTRQRVEDSATAEQTLLVRVGGRKRENNEPWLSRKVSVPLHELCSKSGQDFDDEDNDVYDQWHELTRATLHGWMTDQYATLCAPL